MTKPNENSIASQLIIGDVIACLSRKIFSFETPSPTEMQYMERERGIKSTIDKCMNQLVEFGLAPGIEKVTDRQHAKSLKCVENLSKYIAHLMSELDENKIRTYCEKINVTGVFGFARHNAPFEADHIFLISNSFYTAIATDILWAPQVTVGQAVRLSRGELDLNELGTHLPGLLKAIKSEYIPFFEKSTIFDEYLQGVQEALGCYQKKFFKGCNLILITTIEGMVRRLANFLAPHHELGENFSDEKFLSLNSMLRSVNWKEDFKISDTSLMMITGAEDILELTAVKKVPIGLQYKMVNLNTRLDFLKGRFKDDRDLIMHGSQLDYNKEWNLFLNFSALLETIKVCMYYEQLYG